MKYKCIKTKCPVCGNTGSLQLFLNREGKVTYARVKHRLHENEEDFNPNIKHNYKYCKIEKKQLETLLNSVNIQYPKPNNETPSLGQLGQCGQDAALKTHDPQLRSSSFICQNKWAGSSVRIEHHPPKVGVVGSNPTPPASFVFSVSRSGRLLSTTTSEGLFRLLIFGLSLYFGFC